MPPDCLACGVCCFSDLPHYVAVTGDDYERLGDFAEAFVHFDGNKAFMNMHEGHCSALEVRGEGTFACQLYAVRPQTCRDLERGSPACEGELDLKGSRPGKALLKLRQKAETRRA